ncbi:porin family protein [Flavobacterium sp.]|uniref:porin family protein n=1 Tax=Flavobacterium sp. TaxID=239 RepID=UPI00260248FA|nr:porin family protein [Flavobacterium sp.]MDD3004775.1 porin family protein [Flavobacterium sp.]
MKKLLLGVCILAGTYYSTAQETKFGVRAGIDLATVEQTVSVAGFTTTVKGSETGFFVGGFAEIGMNESFAIQPEVLYVSIKDFSMLNIPVLGKYTVAENINLMAGPSFNYLLDAEEDKFKVNVDLGGSYDITETIDVSARYSLGFGDTKVSGIYLGVGYAF